jgi:hypothetical protein
MNSYLIFEDMKFEAMTGFKQTWPHHTMWSNKPKYKIRICVTFEEYDKIQKLKGQNDISFTFKKNDSEYFIGHFDLESTLGISGYKWGRIIDLHISDLESEKAPKDFCRDLLLNELLG